MEKIGLIIGETASLPKEIIEKFKMICVPFIVDWEAGKNLPGANLFQKMRNLKEIRPEKMPKTSQPTIGTYKKFFEEALSRFEKVISIIVSSRLSGAFNSAVQAKKFLPSQDQERIEIIDSYQGSCGEGILAIKAAQLVQEGKKNFEEIVKTLKEFISEIHLFGMLGDPKWLEAGGRLPHTLASLLRQMAKVGMRPLIGTKEGLVKIVALRMKAKDVPSALFDQFKIEAKEKIENGKNIIIGISHADNLEGAKKLKAKIEKEFKNVKIAFLSLVDPIVGVHGGPDTLLLSWAAESK